MTDKELIAEIKRDQQEAYAKLDREFHGEPYAQPVRMGLGSGGVNSVMRGNAHPVDQHIATIRREQQEAMDALSRLHGPPGWPAARMSIAQKTDIELLNAGVLKRDEALDYLARKGEVKNKIYMHPNAIADIERVVKDPQPKCVDCGATEKLRGGLDAEHTRCVYCYARVREEKAQYTMTTHALHLKHKNCTPAAKMQPEVITCDLSECYE